MAQQVCFRHPEVRTRYKCHHCKRLICENCRRKAAHGHFCGWFCQFKHAAGKLTSLSARTRLRLLLIWNFLLTLLLVLVAWKFFLSGTAQDGSGGAAIKPAISTVIIDSTALFQSPTPHDLILNSELRRMNASSRPVYDLRLQARSGWVVNVWRNDLPVLNEAIWRSGETKFSIPLKYRDNKLRIAAWDRRQKLVFHDYLSIYIENPMVENLRHSISRGRLSRRQVALTFDGGSNHSAAREILEVLKTHRLRCTIFLTGQFVEKYPDVVRDFLRAGHEIGNHTYNHPHLTSFTDNGRHELPAGVDRRFVLKQLRRTDSLYHKLAGRPMAAYWRAPYGEFNQDVLDWAAEAGYRHVHWTRGFDTMDWVVDSSSAMYRRPEQVLQQILEKDNVQQDLNGAIILMHLGSERNRDHIHSMLPQLIEGLHQRKFELVTISELISD